MVGSNLVNKLKKNKSFDVFAPKRSELNLLSKKNIDSYLNSKKINLIIHCAGLVGGIQMNIESQQKSLYENTIMGFNLITAAKYNGVNKFINLGSSCMYPRNLDKDYLESDLLTGSLEPTNEGYAISKIAVWKYLNFASDAEFQGKTIIPCNLYGENDNFGEKTSHLIPAIIRKVHEAKINSTQILIWGDGSARREFAYIGNFVSFVEYCIHNFSDIPNEVNFGTKNDHTIKEFYDIACNIIGAKQNYKFDLSKPVGMNKKKVDTSFQKKHKIIEKYSLEDGIKKTYNFYLKRYGNS